ncbi:hypothetical protein CEXT_395171 [Caerostris extrusa]|uniref:Uncharacterized protein n=1 Tax=Caerostris extrusa TaxID=172846 RepID=A0AAV4WBL6_CAEEX|nr:hypothetical protein CEXT_395171 [Caerostris extrusa]
MALEFLMILDRLPLLPGLGKRFGNNRDGSLAVLEEDYSHAHNLLPKMALEFLMILDRLPLLPGLEKTLGNNRDGSLA